MRTRQIFRYASRQVSSSSGRRDRGVAIVARALTVVSIILLAASSAATAQTDLTFEKSSVSESAWVGRVDGDVSGQLVTTLIAIDQSASPMPVEFYWIVLADDPAQSFVARLTGTLDGETGEAKMAGFVVDGYMKGAAVEEAGQLQDADTSTFTGTIVIDQATTGSPDPDSPIIIGALRMDR